MDGYSHHDHQKRDLQVSRKGVIDSWEELETGEEGSKRGISQGDSIIEMLVLRFALYTCLLALINIVFRL